MRTTTTIRLYHFTGPRAAAAILVEREGIVGDKGANSVWPEVFQGWGHVGATPVWLTENTEPIGIGFQGRPIRLAVDLDASDPGLVRWDTWSATHLPEAVRKQLPDDGAVQDNGERVRPQEWWLYFGAIAAERLTMKDMQPEAGPLPFRFDWTTGRYLFFGGAALRV